MKNNHYNLNNLRNRQFINKVNHNRNSNYNKAEEEIKVSKVYQKIWNNKVSEDNRVKKVFQSKWNHKINHLNKI